MFSGKGTAGVIIRTPIGIVHPVLERLEVEGRVIRVASQVAGRCVRQWRGGCRRTRHQREERRGDHQLGD